MDDLRVISVVRDFATYERCVRKNPHIPDGSIVMLDNRERNDFVGSCYNRFLDGYDYTRPAWFVFCHEDFEIQDDIVSVLAGADKHSVYGPIGVVTRVRLGLFCQWWLQGLVSECDRTGNGEVLVGRSVPRDTPVETLDCQCLIVHSSFVQKTGIRFDENLSFDLYVEDFCIQAKENYAAITRILPLKCRHWSHGNVQKRYFEQEAYLKRKWPGVCYTGTSSHIIGGGAGMRRRLNAFLIRAAQHILALMKGKAQ